MALIYQWRMETCADLSAGTGTFEYGQSQRANEQVLINAAAGNTRR